eukprot:TRINITY_DN2232_c0_g1_i2.p1 TRINITY_DN2232_c0_g1~~TRINITY_DN2232_c0_g1_i2.p1  ORF type:complete len:173 (-),score=19.88 TRINITY_DN2232_c0_g1_i2:225-743(-)
MPYVSPKGDHPGFAQVVQRNGRGVAVQIPDRPGNRLVFGHQNVLNGSGHVGLLFEIPGTNTTVRCGGRAKLSYDPELLSRHRARGLDAKLVMHVEIEYAFVHCSKAYLRSELWKPESWPEDPYPISFGSYFIPDDIKAQIELDQEIEGKYKEVEKSISGECVEPDYAPLPEL